MKKLKLLFFSGKRGGINHFIPIIKKLKRLKYFDVHLLLSDMHLSEQFGSTHKNYNNLKTKIYKTKTIKKNYKASKIERAYSLSDGMKKNIDILRKIKPDLLIILGDRSELFSIATPSLILNIPIAHFYGGDITQGCTDEPTRHSLSMISNFHFVSNQRSKNNLLKFKIDPKNIFNVGLSSLHSINKKNILDKKSIFEKYKLDHKKKLFLIIQHPETWNLKDTRKQIKCTLRALRNFKENKIFVYPCSDPGSKIIIDEIKKLKKNYLNKVFKDIKFEDFYSLFDNADIIIGNSSAGILESHFFKTPALNIGDRQKNRFQTVNILNSDFNVNNIERKIKQILNKKYVFSNSKSFYYKSNGINKIIKIFKKLNFKKKDNFKQLLKLN
tara:strand:- start:349 stop:1503 length:1155 start_codon:yes stop_codon:yes gene_type:complete